MKAMLAEFSYFMEKYFGKTSILWSIVFMAVCCAVIFITITRVIEYIVEKRGNSGRQKVVHWSNDSVKAAELSKESGAESKKTGELPKKKTLKFKLYGLYTVYSAFILLCSYSFNKLVLLTYTWDSKLQRVMSNFTYMLSFKSNRKLFFNALSLPDNVFNKNHVFNIALYLNDSQWDNNFQDNNVQNNNAQNNNVQSNNARNNNSAWNNQSQTDNNMQTTSRTDNESAVKMPENPIPTSTPVPTPKPTKHPKPTKTPKSTQTPTPKSSKKKNKKKQNKAKKTEKDNTNTDNSKVLQNKEDQGDTAEYTHVKDESVKFYCTQNTDSSHTPQIQIISQGSVQILSFRINGTECPWHWEGDRIIPEIDDKNVKEIEVLVISQGGKLIKMDPWIFSA